MKPELSFTDRSQFRSWLKTRGPQSEGVWIVFDKSAKGTSLFAGEALEEALCFGWIDGLIKGIDEKRYKKYFSPRKPKSKWSDRNKKIIETLLGKKMVEKQGLLAIERAKKDGSWDLKHDTGISAEKYKLFESKIASNKKAYDNYLAMPASIKKQFVGLYFEPKKDETRERKLAELMDLLKKNVKPMEKYSKK